MHWPPSFMQRSNIAMKRLVLLAAFLALPLALAAQTTSATASVTSPANGPANLAGLLYAANFAHWTASPTPQGTRWDNPGQCYGTSGGLVFPLYSTSAPITIVDLGVPSNTETVTPTLASYLGSGCSVSLPATHPHSNYYLQSGTLGLQEALNFAGSAHYVVVLTPDWQTMGGTTGMITSATAGTNTTILAARTSTLVPYSGGTPAAGTTGTGKTVLQTSPTLISPTSNTVVLTAAAPTVAASQVGLGGTTAAASNCNTVGTSPAACLVVNIAGTVHYIPYQ
jgi:hypothetical protein